MPRLSVLSLLSLLSLLSCVASCADAPNASTRSAEVLGGREVPGDVLARGARVYELYCESCHGPKGDGAGPSAIGMFPPPRDFRNARFKFAGTEGEQLAGDDALAVIIRRGLGGVAMAGWQLPDDDLRAVIQHIKTFSPAGEGYRDSARIVKEGRAVKDAVADPYEGQVEKALTEGEQLYHSEFQCAQCHPQYVAFSQYEKWQSDPSRIDRPFDSMPKYAPGYGVMILPPDFLRHELRSVWPDTSLLDLVRIISHGLQGPMPGYGHLGMKKVWAVAHYVNSLQKMRDTPEGAALRTRLKASPIPSFD